MTSQRRHEGYAIEKEPKVRVYGAYTLTRCVLFSRMAPALEERFCLRSLRLFVSHFEMEIV